ncbi:phosphonate ABC transporter ATP-binding protein [Marinomonas primoryensis]|uniref:Phosphonate ABC transporter ATP-binding protein n=1 Tax=Marinomonas primoryensis TaxID=178399 RepID=A0A2Z4PRK6_9GAMM|nr:phosphonate ABC transporter ATP-binding protein [Marinomonas primoryensis]AWY00103.1 phosphonate ABC transporter ATP-binding protein [Marinomonas primoryensis]QKK81380.1 phosphonate ABC transporter ATP-binding protein PhnC [Marinomonas primoryensis]|tara:strand:- start:8738 stop:9613 length:876 start_codon:yes stop_codon:yes gene_type:complete
MSIIEITGVKKHFTKEVCALKHVDLSIKQGEMVALIGPSGSGKSTLMRHISGLTLADKHSDSCIKVLGNTIQQRGKLDKHVRTSRSQIGNVFQQFNLVSRLSVLTNVMIGGLSRIPTYRSLLGWFTAEEKHMALEALERVGLKNVALKRASELSGGQQQRVAIARALMQKAKVILADEPIASLDPESSRLIMQTLKDINEKDGITVVVTLHQVDYAQKYCERAVALQDGEVFFDNLIHHLNEENLASLYGSQPEELSINDSSQAILNEMPLPKNGRITTEINHATHHSLIN